jgi:hypothetical protein
MPKPRTLLSRGKSHRQRSVPNSARDSVRITDRNRMLEPHPAQLASSRSSTPTRESPLVPHMLHVNCPMANGIHVTISPLRVFTWAAASRFPPE